MSHTRHLNNCKSINNICQLCDETFDQVVELRTHVYEEHSGKLFSCNLETCPLSFTTKKGQEYHIKNAHKSYACTQCKQIFPSAGELSLHKMSDEHKKINKRVKCQGCNSTFSGRFEAERHFKSTCVFNPKREVKCGVCKIETGLACDFLKHLQSEHSVTSGHLCTRCLVHFHSELRLEAHLKNCDPSKPKKKKTE